MFMLIKVQFLENSRSVATKRACDGTYESFLCRSSCVGGIRQSVFRRQ